MLLDLRGHHLYPKYGPVTRPQYVKLKVESRKKKDLLNVAMLGRDRNPVNSPESISGILK